MAQRRAAALVDSLLAPAQAVLVAVDPAAAKAKRARMRGSPFAFYRATLALQLPALAARAGADGPWAWAVGDAHLANFATVASGVERGGDGPRVVFDVADGDEEHPAPWAWDLLRFCASLAVARPRMDRAALRGLARLTFARYAEVMARAAEDDLEHGARVFVQDLPPSVVALMERDGDPARRRSWLKETIARGRLRRRDGLSDDAEAKRTLAPVLAAALADSHAARVIDLCRREASGVGSLGLRRWLALAVGPDAGAVRTIEIKERRPSELARVVPALPDHRLPRRGIAVTVALGGDPCQVVLPGAAWPLLARTRCHARTALDPAAIAADELPALARLCATLIARFHARGLALCGVDVPARAEAIAADARRRGEALSALPWDLAQDNRAAFAIWKARKA